MTSFIDRNTTNDKQAPSNNSNNNSSATRDALKRTHPLFSLNRNKQKFKFHYTLGICGVYHYPKKRKLAQAIKDMIRHDFLAWVFLGILAALAVCILTLGLLPRPEGLTNHSSKNIKNMSMRSYGSR